MVAPGSETHEARGSVLDPVERLSEVLFGLIMALTFTGSIHAASDGREEIRTVLVGAIGCNIAWGIVDAVMYVMAGLVARGRAVQALGRLRRATTLDEATEILTDALPESVAKRMERRDYESLHGWLSRVPLGRVRLLTSRDLRGAFGVFVLVTLSTFPVVVPFLVLGDAVSALRVSNAVALTMLFLIGWALGKHAGARPLLTGIAMLAIGVVLVALTIALGG